MIDKCRLRILLVRRIKPYANEVKKEFVFLFGSYVMDMLLVLILPFIYGIFIDDVIVLGNLPALLGVVAGYLLVQVGQTFLMFERNNYRNKISNKVSISIKEKILSNYLEKSFQEIYELDTTNLKMILDEDMIKLDAFTDSQTINYLISGVKGIIVLGILVFLDWRLAIIALIIIPITLFFDYKSAKRSKIVNDEQRQNYSRWTNWLHQTIENWHEVRALNLEQYEYSQFNKYCGINAKYFTLKTRWWVTQSMVLPKIKDEFFMQFFLYFVGGILIYFGHISIGALLVFTQYYLMFSQTLQTVSQTDIELIENLDFYKRVLDAAEDERKSSDLCQDSPSDFDIEFQNVSFRYPNGEANIISNFNLKIISGERIGIVGESGKGKTTILRLMMGLFYPQMGKILFGGKDLQSWDRRVIFSHIGFIMQENMLYNISIRENLFYGKESANQKDLEDACRKAYILDFITEQPEGFDTIIGERGIKLSGGQRQRLILARLFLRNVDIFIFDEATSALDQHAENLVQQAIEGIEKEKTIIVVSHRESSLRLCNRIVKI